jgi:hypothetical protein
MNSPMKVKSKKILFFSILIVCTVFYILLETVSFLSLSPEEKKLSPSQLLQVNQNQYIEEFTLKTGCLFSETIIAHPILGYVHRHPEYMSARCRNTTPVNNINMRSERDLPLIKNKNEFAVLILGGSVAEQFANYKDSTGTYYFEEILNKKIKLPGGKKFKIYNGALGGWAMPNQINMMLMYHERIDGIVSLDGYNEATPIQRGERLEQVLPDLFLLATSTQGSFNQLYLRTLWALQYGLAHKVIKHSYFFNVSYKIMVALFQGFIMSPEKLLEYKSGNSETIPLDLEQRRAWSLNSFHNYLINFHELGKAKGLKVAQFLQPTRMYGKVLTESESKPREYNEKNTYIKIESLYNELAEKKYPVRSLTNVFRNEREDIYADHIHYIKTSNNYSKGNELVANAMADYLKQEWKF